MSNGIANDKQNLNDKNSTFERKKSISLTRVEKPGINSNNRNSYDSLDGRTIYSVYGKAEDGNGEQNQKRKSITSQKSKNDTESLGEKRKSASQILNDNYDSSDNKDLQTLRNYYERKISVNSQKSNNHNPEENRKTSMSSQKSYNNNFDEKRKSVFSQSPDERQTSTSSQKSHTEYNSDPSERSLSQQGVSDATNLEAILETPKFSMSNITVSEKSLLNEDTISGTNAVENKETTTTNTDLRNHCMCPQYTVCDWSMNLELRYDMLRKREAEFLQFQLSSDNQYLKNSVPSNEKIVEVEDPKPSSYIQSPKKIFIEKDRKSSISLPASLGTVKTNSLVEESKLQKEKAPYLPAISDNKTVEPKVPKPSVDPKVSRDEKIKLAQKKKQSSFFQSIKRMFTFTPKSGKKNEAGSCKLKEVSAPKRRKTCQKECAGMQRVRMKEHLKEHKKCDKVMVVRQLMVPILITEEIESEVEEEAKPKVDVKAMAKEETESVRLDKVEPQDEEIDIEMENKETVTEEVYHVDADTEIDEMMYDKKDKHTSTVAIISKDVQTVTEMGQSLEVSENQKNKDHVIDKFLHYSPPPENNHRIICQAKASLRFSQKHATRRFICRCKKEAMNYSNQYNLIKSKPMEICYNSDKCLIDNELSSNLIMSGVIKKTKRSNLNHHFKIQDHCSHCPCDPLSSPHLETIYHKQSPKNLSKLYSANEEGKADGKKDKKRKDAPPMICIYCDQTREICTCEREVQVSLKGEDYDSFGSLKDSLECEKNFLFSDVLSELNKKIKGYKGCQNCGTPFCQCQLIGDDEVKYDEVKKRHLMRPTAKCYYCKTLPCECSTSVNIFKT